MTLTGTEPLKLERWDDLRELFGERGAQGGCWCMWWRVPGPEFAPGKASCDALRALVQHDQPTGILGYSRVDGVERAIAWAALSPRHHFRRLERSPLRRHQPADPGIWAMPCLFVAHPLRNRGVAGELVGEACIHAAAQGGRVLEAYPTTSATVGPAGLYVGTVGLFSRAGFTEHRRATPQRPVMRRTLANLSIG